MTEGKKKTTKELLAESLKGLMHEHSFEKITIKMITDEAGVIRPTFYNYFCDKYEVLEWIFQEEIIRSVGEMFDLKMYAEGIKLFFVSVNQDHEFYKKAFMVHGQNSFKSIVQKALFRLFVKDVDTRGGVTEHSNPLITKELVAEYYAVTMANVMKEWINADYQDYTVDQLVEAFEFLLTHRITDYISQK